MDLVLQEAFSQRARKGSWEQYRCLSGMLAFLLYW